LERVVSVEEKVPGSISFIENQVEYCVPLVDMVNVEEELKKLKEELKYAEGFLKSVVSKLSNEKFVSGAPEAVVANERKKQTDTETKIAMLKEQIAELTGNGKLTVNASQLSLLLPLFPFESLQNKPRSANAKC
jgi:valyl-tRNA synthetase